jgi:uncharacterized protein
MRLSKYNFLFKSEKYGFLNYNSISNSFIKLNSEIYNKLKSNEFNQIDVDVKNELIKLKIIVNEEDDNNFFLELKTSYYKSVFQDNILGLAIAPTLACNFDCIYCFEHNKSSNTINEETINKIIAFIKSHDRISGLNITWYGGEPLLEIKKIYLLYKKISELGIPLLRHGMVTNGYLLVGERLNLVKKMRLDYIQFTIDGLEDTHNKKRLHKNRKIGTFKTIIENINGFIEVNPKTKVIIRIHVDKDNKHEYAILYNEFQNKWENKNVYIYPAFIRGDINSCSSSCSSFTEQNEMFRFYSDLYLKQGFNVKFFPEYDLGGCNATSINTYVLGPEGELYKCWNDIGIKERIIGYIDSNVLINKPILLKYLVDANKYEDPTCRDCILFPVCSGGCPYYRVEKSVTGIDNYPLLCSIGKESIKECLEIHYEQQLSKKVTNLV